MITSFCVCYLLTWEVTCFEVCERFAACGFMFPRSLVDPVLFVTRWFSPSRWF
jgi:hypothetical protein